MTICANLHNLAKVKPYTASGDEYPTTSWLEMSDEEGNTFTVFMPLSLATAFAELFTAHKAAGAAR